jgi:hypothetical protein
MNELFLFQQCESLSCRCTAYIQYPTYAGFREIDSFAEGAMGNAPTDMIGNFLVKGDSSLVIVLYR